MKTIQKFTVVIMVLFAFAANAQTYNNTTSEFIGFQKKASEMSFLSAQNPQTAARNLPPSGNNIFINQIGLDNKAVVNAKSDSADLNILQNGSNNDLYYQVSAATIQGSLVQNGDNNSIFHTNPFEIKSHEAQILQNGNNQNVEWSGSNSVSEKMKLTMQGDSQTIIIRNLN